MIVDKDKQIYKDEKSGRIFFGPPQYIPFTVQQIRRGMGIYQYQGRLEQYTIDIARSWFETAWCRSLTDEENAKLMIMYEGAYREFHAPEKEE